MYPNTNLQPGQTGAEVKKLQDFLVSQGLMTPQQVATGPGIYGPQTTAAVKAWQQQNGVDNTSGPGYWGPKSIAAASGTGKTDPNQPYSDQEYTDAVGNHPIIQKYTSQGNSPADLEYAASSGDLSGIKNEFGQPFSLEQQQEALKQATEDTSAFYEAQKTKETADTQAALAQKQADYQNYLATSKTNFEGDKTNLDQNAANSGVLFSGGRAQKEQALQNKYSQDQAYQQGNVGRDIASTAQDYQYKYGTQPATNLSQYYNLGGNSYNANVAQNGVSSNGLSSMYNPSSYNLGSGSRIKEQAIDANKRAAGLLWNKGNKLLSTGYSNQY